VDVALCNDVVQVSACSSEPFQENLIMTERKQRRPCVVQITPAERTALQLLAKGEESPKIARSLGVSEPEIDSVLTALFATMGTATQSEAVVEAQRRGLL